MLFVLQKLSKPTMTYFQKALKGFCLFIFFNYQMISKLKISKHRIIIYYLRNISWDYRMI